MDPYSSTTPFEMVSPDAMDPNALNGVSQPTLQNTVDWGAPQQSPAAGEGRSWSDKIKEALMLAATVAPIGKMMGSRMGRLALGAGAGAGATAIMTDPAQAAEAGTGDAVLDALNTQLKLKQGMYQSEFNGTGGSKKKGDGPKAQGIQLEINNLLGQIQARQNELRNQSLIETPAQKLEREKEANELERQKLDAAKKRADDNRGRFLEGAGAGAAAGGAMSLAAGALTRGRFNRFQQVADDLNALTKGARKETFAGKGTADEVAGLVDEANTLRGQPKTFGENPSKFGNTYSDEGVRNIVDDGANLGPFRSASSEAKATGKAVTESRKASGPDMGENFDKPYSFGAGEWAVPAIGAADYAIMEGVAANQDKPEDAQAYHDYANFGLGFGLGAKGARAATKPFTKLMAQGAKTAPINTAKNKLQRELSEAAGGPATKAAAPAAGSPGTGPAGGVKAPPGQGGGLPVAELQKRAAAANAQRAAFHADPGNKSMADAIGAVQSRGARVTADTVMRELRGKHGSKVDGVPINRRQIGRWLSRHGYLGN